MIISDDGLQHYKMGRHIEIAVIDGKRRFGNNLTFPAGPLREASKRINTVDFIVNNSGAQAPLAFQGSLPRRGAVVFVSFLKM